jgi:hypothetical protein
VAAPLKAPILWVGTTDRMALGEVLNIVAVQTAAAALQALSGFHAHVVVANIGTSDRETRALLASLRDPDATPRHARACR